MSEIATVYVKLLNEGTNVWRPVQARHLHDHCFLLLGEADDDETWEFSTGSTVICEHRELSGGICEVAVRLSN